MRAAWRRPLAVALCFAAFLPAPGPRTEGALAEDERDASGPLSGGPDSGGSGEWTGRAWSYTAVAWGGGVRPLVSSSHLPTRHITVTPNSTGLNRAMVFPVALDGCESWALKKAERRRMDASELWCWRRPLRVPWTARRSNQSILKEISPGCSLEGLMLKLKL